MADISSYVRYFELIAQEHQDILHTDQNKHFFMMDINELLSAANSTAKYPAIVLLKLKGNVYDKSMDNPLFTMDGGFIVLDHCKQVDDFATELQIFQDSFRMGMEIIARITHDQQACCSLATKAIPDFDPDHVRWEMIGPVFDNHFGIIFRFPVKLLLNIEYDPSIWFAQG